MESVTPTLKYSLEYCRRLTYRHYENFPVASKLMPSELRQHICNIYAFARTADDFADEPGLEQEERMERLIDWGDMLEAAYKGEAIHPIFVALEYTISYFNLPIQLFRDLLTAFKMDVVNNRYNNFDEVLHYCRHSANPVGRLILHLFNYINEDWFEWSDNICTGLQLANFWQDVSVDLKKDRIYLPLDEMKSAGVTIQQLFDHQNSDALRGLMAFQVDRTQKIFDEGQLLCHAVPNRRLKYELKLTWLGGTTILQKIRENGYNAFTRPTITTGDKLKLLVRAFFWRG